MAYHSTLSGSDGTALGTQALKTSPGPTFYYLTSAAGLVFIQALGGGDGSPSRLELRRHARGDPARQGLRDAGAGQR